MSANDPNTTNTFVETTIDVTECPLCGEMLQGLLVNLVEMPTDKLGDISAKRTQMKMTAVSFELFRHACEKVDPQPERPEFRQRGRGNRFGSFTEPYEGLVNSGMITLPDSIQPQVRRGMVRYQR